MLSDIAQLRAWRDGFDHEFDFWRCWLETKGSEWPEDFRQRLDPQKPVDALIGGIIQGRGLREAEILDVGAGPMTCLGFQMPGVRVKITALDPLALGYRRLLDEQGLTPVTRTEFATAEDLSYFIDGRQFDIVHCQNALDHSFDPMRGILQMLKAVKMGGAVVLRHYRNEAETARYTGLHQSNFDAIEGRFTIWNKRSKIDVARAIPIDVDIQCELVNEKIVVVIKKKAEFTEPPVDARVGARVREILTSVVALFIEESFSRLERQLGRGVHVSEW
jgi:SAM-dependent methyltransferase